MQPAFTPDRIAGYADTMAAFTDEALDGWRDGEVRDVHAEAMELTLRIIAEAMFGIEMDRDVETVGESMEAVMAQSERVWQGFIPDAVPTPGRRRYREAVESLTRWCTASSASASATRATTS
ncbi:hypothetical protein [Halosegnis marinus]|uniref:hypothetical protein n=1 Tax=Halosegnis marinus TaxID=3034023 RepID=UPI00361DFFB4